jgi:hypothetical protein
VVALRGLAVPRGVAGSTGLSSGVARPRRRHSAVVPLLNLSLHVVHARVEGRAQVAAVRRVRHDDLLRLLVRTECTVEVPCNMQRRAVGQ